MTDGISLGGSLLVIFDGHCGFCNGSVRWFLRRDTQARLRFVPSQSPKVAELLARHGFAPSDLETGPDTILVVRDAFGPNEQVLTRTDATVAMLNELSRPWPSIARIFGWIPRAIRDLGYRLVARWRYRIWGRLDSCPLPTPAERGRFL